MLGRLGKFKTILKYPTLRTMGIKIGLKEKVGSYYQKHRIEWYCKGQFFIAAKDLGDLHFCNQF